jgi:hypothetical protein
MDGLEPLASLSRQSITAWKILTSQSVLLHERLHATVENFAEGEKSIEMLLKGLMKQPFFCSEFYLDINILFLSCSYSFLLSGDHCSCLLLSLKNSKQGENLRTKVCVDAQIIHA